MDWNAAADACLKVWKGGGYQLAIFILCVVMCFKPPWRRTRQKADDE